MPRRKSMSQVELQEADNDEPQALDPIIVGLLDRLPAPGEAWPKVDRALWLGILDQVFRLIYLAEDDGEDAVS